MGISIKKIDGDYRTFWLNILLLYTLHFEKWYKKWTDYTNRLLLDIF